MPFLGPVLLRWATKEILGEILKSENAVVATLYPTGSVAELLASLHWHDSTICLVPSLEAATSPPLIFLQCLRIPTQEHKFSSSAECRAESRQSASPLKLRGKYSEGHLKHHAVQTELIHDSSLQCCPSQQMAEEKSHMNSSVGPVSAASSLP